MHRRNLTARAAHWSARHRKLAIFGWLGAVVASVLLSGAFGLNTIKLENQGVGESKRGDQIQAKAGFFDRANENVLIQARGGQTADSPAFRAAITDVAGRLRAFPDVRAIKSPLAAGNEGQISRDRHSALVNFYIRGDQDQAKDRVAPILAAMAAAQARHPQLRVEQFGDASANKALTKVFEDDFKRAETLSLPITLLILVIAFGALVAAGIPLLLGLSAVVITLGILAPLSQISAVDQSIQSVVLLIGLAVGVDYSLFYIRRERDERRAGRSKDAALDVAAATSGRAVLISGCTVMVAMAGMYFTGSATFMSFATGTILVVAVAMIGSLTVLPAVLSKLGDRIDKGRVPLISRLRRSDPEGGFWSWIVDRVLRRPVISAVLATAFLVVLAIPAFSMHTVNSGVNGIPRDIPIMKTYDRMQAAFPGGSIPANVVVKATDVTLAGVAQGIRDMRDEAIATGLMREPVTVSVSPNKQVAVVSIPIVGNGTDSRSNAALTALRDKVIPNTVGKIEGVDAPVTGMTAGSTDFNDLVRSRAPLVFVFVLSLAFLLLLATFRSVVIPIKAITLNLLSVGAAYGVMVWIFQDGHLENLLGFQSIGGIVSWLPLFLFVILFGLSMDYHVFILTRVRECFDHGQPTGEAVRHGIKSTASVVTSAALVMVFVFGIFATLSALDFKQMGVGLAVAVLLDATIVRAVLLPATMKLLGDWNWYLPRWLEWLPRIEPEQDAAPLRVSVVHGDGRTTVEVSGELDLATVGQLRDALAAVEDDEQTLVLDLRELEFLDSVGIGELLAAHRRARAAGRHLILLKSESTPIAHVLATTGVDGEVEVLTSEN
jgi:RND superfamily putative drug exporter